MRLFVAAELRFLQKQIVLKAGGLVPPGRGDEMVFYFTSAGECSIWVCEWGGVFVSLIIVLLLFFSSGGPPLHDLHGEGQT